MPGFCGVAAEISEDGTSPGSVNTARSFPDVPASMGRDPNPFGAPPRRPPKANARAIPARAAMRVVLDKEKESLRKRRGKIKDVSVERAGTAGLSFGPPVTANPLCLRYWER